MKAIVIAFTLKGQPFEKILAQLEKIAQENPTQILLHSFMPRALVVEKGFPTIVLDAIDKLFPIQLNMFLHGAPLRTEMAEVAAKLEATVYVVGEIKEGVAEDVERYKEMGLPVINYQLE